MARVNVAALPGMMIGSDTIIGAGSMVNKDIPSGVIVFANPCRVDRKITPMNRLKYLHWEDSNR